MVEYKQEYAELNDKNKKSVSFDEIFVDITKSIFGITQHLVLPLKDLFIKKQKNGRDYYEKIKSVSEYDHNEIGNVFYLDESEIYNSIGDFYKLVHKAINVPEVYQSTTLNKTGATEAEKVAFGLKRDLKVKEVENGNCLYVQINDKWTFVEKENIYWYEGSTLKRYSDFKALTDDEKKNVKLYDNQKREITGIYTVYEYDLEKVEAKEEVDLNKGEKKTYSKAKDGSYTYQTEKLNMTISSQTFTTQEVDDDKNYGEKKDISVDKVINYKVAQNGEYVCISVDSQLKMVKLDDLVDIEGNPIASLDRFKQMVGQCVKLKENGAVVSTSDPLTFEQANLTYDTIKTYQQLEGLATDTSCLRLEDGSYVKELETVQPISYKVVDGDDYDKILIEQTVGSEKKFVVMDKDYLSTNGKVSGLDTTKVAKLKRCDFKDNDCSIVQTTSTDAEIEQCVAVKKVTVAGSEVQKLNKDVAYESFLTGYKQGIYKIHDIYLSGDKKSLQKNSGRYEYTDVAYYEDWADNLPEYKGVKEGELKLKDGKVEGGEKFDFGKALKKVFSIWGIATFGAITVAPFAGIFVTALAPLVSAYAMGCLAAAPIIPMVTGGVALFKNREKTKYTDKTNYNRKKLEKQINKELDELYSRKDLNEKGFEDAYSKIMNKIAMLSQTTSNNSLTLVNGTATVNANNVNLAHRYKHSINSNAKLVEKNEKAVAKAQAKVAQLQAKVAKYVDLPVPASIQNKFDKAKKELDELLEEQKILTEQQSSLINTSVGESYAQNPKMNELQRKAQSIRLMKYIEQFSDSSIVAGMPDELKTKIKLNKAKDNILIDGVSIFSDEETVEKQSKEWKNLIDEALTVLDDMNKIELEKPNNGNVKEEIDKVQQKRNDLVDAVDEFIASVESIRTKITEKVSGTEQERLFNELNEIENKVEKEGLNNLTDDEVDELKILVNEQKTKLSDLDKEIDNLIDELNKAKQEEKKEKSFDSKINSEDKLVVLLKANEKSKDRKKLIQYIKEKSGVEIKEEDIKETIDRIDDKHIKGKNATLGAAKLKNKNIDLILSYGQKYLTWYAEEIKKRMAEHSA